MPAFVVGTRVEAKFDDGEDFYPGTIVAVSAAGTFDVQYDDGDSESGLTSDLIQMLDSEDVADGAANGDVADADDGGDNHSDGDGDGDDKSDEEAVTCGICLDDIDPAVYAKFEAACEHIYHSACIQEWAKKENKCPMCKARFRAIIEMKDGDKVCLRAAGAAPTPWN